VGQIIRNSVPGRFVIHKNLIRGFNLQLIIQRTWPGLEKIRPKCRTPHRLAHSSMAVVIA
jgi:hypothetical protein